MKINIIRFVGAPIFLAVMMPFPAYADAIDLTPYFTRVGYRNSDAVTVGLMILLMAVNYAVNFIVIGLPAVRWGAVPIRQVASSLVRLTLLGQVADRAGALLAVLAMMPLGYLYAELNINSMDAFILPLLVMNVLLSGVSVGWLAFYFLRRRWKVQPGLAWKITILAAIFTNPALMSTPFLYFSDSFH